MSGITPDELCSMARDPEQTKRFPIYCANMFLDGTLIHRDEVAGLVEAAKALSDDRHDRTPGFSTRNRDHLFDALDAALSSPTVQAVLTEGGESCPTT